MFVNTRNSCTDSSDGIMITCRSPFVALVPSIRTSVFESVPPVPLAAPLIAVREFASPSSPISVPCDVDGLCTPGILNATLYTFRPAFGTAASSSLSTIPPRDAVSVSNCDICAETVILSVIAPISSRTSIPTLVLICSSTFCRTNCLNPGASTVTTYFPGIKNEIEYRPLSFDVTSVDALVCVFTALTFALPTDPPAGSVTVPANVDRKS